MSYIVALFYCSYFYQVLVNHPHLLGRGILSVVPTIDQVLLRDMPAIHLTSEQVFLRDFIACSGDTAGARMAKYVCVLCACVCVLVCACMCTVVHVHVYVLGTACSTTSCFSPGGYSQTDQ